MEFKRRQIVAFSDQSSIKPFLTRSAKRKDEKEKTTKSKQQEETKRNQIQQNTNFNDALLAKAFVQVNPRNECKILFRTT